MLTALFVLMIVFVPGDARTLISHGAKAFSGSNYGHIFERIDWPLSYFPVLNISKGSVCMPPIEIEGVLKEAVTGDVRRMALLDPMFHLGCSRSYLLRRRMGAALVFGGESRIFLRLLSYALWPLDVLVMPFGLTNDPAVFMDLIEPYFPEYLDNVRYVFHTSTSSFTPIAFPLVINVLADGIIMDPSKGEALHQMAETYYGNGGSVVFRNTVMHRRKVLGYVLNANMGKLLGASMRIESNLMLQIKEAQRGRRWYLRLRKVKFDIRVLWFVTKTLEIPMGNGMRFPWISLLVCGC
ncbi:hypothetical protein Tco_0940429 [Tanacetum coccineum]|uniref:Uncharacterized protein n=1 Tax=Tanacetum coccineum TaxID=301880 RepID=A0ABQ5DNI0_9ASTR